MYPKKNINIKAPPELYYQLRQCAFDKHISQAEVVRRAVAEYLDREKADATNTE